jgi:hypothetical protein
MFVTCTPPRTEPRFKYHIDTNDGLPRVDQPVYFDAVTLASSYTWVFATTACPAGKSMRWGPHVSYTWKDAGKHMVSLHTFNKIQQEDSIAQPIIIFSN